jgi:hypothetical protein
MKKHNLYALVAAGLLASGMSVSSASAADLGGNCCADLEERIAELEATTARKGNRKVSLTVSGWVGQQVSFWDDGVESNTYVHDLGSTLGSHVKFTGSAQISPGWSAGYVLQIEAISSDSLTINQNQPNGPGLLGGGAGGVQTLQSYWFIKSDQLGKVGVGLQSAASDNTAILVDGSGSLVPANWVGFDQVGFFMRRKNGTLQDGSSTATPTGLFTTTTTVNSAANWGNVGGCVWGDCAGVPSNSVRYDSPTFGGFSVSATWGEDDFWDAAVRYAGEWSGFKVAAAGAYSETSEFATSGPGQPADTQYFQAGAFVMHVPTGLFAYGAYGNLDSDGVSAQSETWYGKVGLRSRLSALGHTVFYGEYLNNKDGGVGVVTSSSSEVFEFGAVSFGRQDDQFITGSDMDVWGVGLVQEIDAAAMSVWVKYRHSSADASFGQSCTTVSNVGGNACLGAAPVFNTSGFEDFQYVGVGGLINF